MNTEKPTIDLPSNDEVAALAGQPDGATVADAPGSGEAPTLEALAREVKDLRDRLLRSQAEVQNVTRRLTDERETALRYANAAFARSLLPIWDNLDRTLAHCQDHHEQDPVIQGVRLVYDMFKKVLTDQGIEQIESMGRPFDPSMHEALLHEPTTDQPAGHVLREFEKGFRMKDRVLRAAKVVIASEPPAEKP